MLQYKRLHHFPIGRELRLPSGAQHRGGVGQRSRDLSHKSAFIKASLELSAGKWHAGP